MSEPVVIGAALGQYRIEAKIGQGGMGVVYRALDTRLNRQVAMKFLSADVADAGALRRFQREAQMASGLNHPHLVTVHDIGEADGQQYVVTELVDGGTLSDWVAAAPRSRRQIVELLLGVAEGLAAAHDAHILHRDIKPGNILVSRNGYAKLADFGVAKLFDTSASDQTQTQTSLIVGTPAYMSPEQATAGKCDARSDLFSFGVVLYEMLSGKRPFEAKSTGEVLQKVIHESPAPLNDSIPAPLRDLVEKTLEKDPNDRYQAAREMVVDLRRIARRTETGTGKVSSSVPPRALPRRRWWIPVVAAVAIAATVVIFVFRGGNAGTAVQTHLQIAPPKGGLFVVGVNPTVGSMAVSPNGEMLAAVATVEGSTSLWIESLQDGVARKVERSRNAQRPFWSPDSKSIAFFATDGLYRVDAAGGEPVLLAKVDANYPMGGSWSEDGLILFFSTNGGIVQAVSASGGQPRVLLEKAGFPQALPGGAFLYFSGADNGGAVIYAAPIAHPEKSKRLVNASGHGVYASGYLLWLEGTSLLAQPFNPSTLSLSGHPQRILDPVVSGPFNEPSLTVSTTGRMIYDNEIDKDRQLAWYTRTRQRPVPIGKPGSYQGFRLFEKGRLIAIQANADKDRGLWLMDEKGMSSPIISGGFSVNPMPSPDGKSIVYGVPPGGLSRIDITGQNKRSLQVTDPKIFQFPTDWSGDVLLFSMLSDRKIDIWSLRVASDGSAPSGVKPDEYLRTPSLENNARFAPGRNQHWLAHESDESGLTEVYVQSFPTKGTRVKVSNKGGTFPVWGPEGRELFYLAFGDNLMVVDVTYGQDSISVSTPRELFTIPPSPIPVSSPYDTLDGQRFLVLAPVTPANHPMQVIDNWTALIKP